MKTAFVCSGGGAKGAWEAGVIRQLATQGIKPDVIYGTSVGALNAAGYAYNGDEGLEKLWHELSGDSAVLWPTGWRWLYAWPRMLWASGIYSTKPLRKLLDAHIAGTPRCEAVACSVRLRDGVVMYRSNLTTGLEEFKDAVQASAAIPLMMEPINWEVDGGVREQTPLARAIQDGCKRIYVILANPWEINPQEKWEPKQKLLKWFFVLDRAVNDLMCHEIFVTDIQECLDRNSDPGYHNVELIVYAPDKQYIDTLDFNPEKIRIAYAAGLTASALNIG